MIRFLLDTDTCVFALRNAFGVYEKIDRIGRQHCCISEITLAELKFGAFKSDRKIERLRAVEYFCGRFEVLPISNVLDIFAETKANLERQGKPLDDFDLLIGATALHYDLVLATNNTNHFARILPDRLENWKT